MDNYNRNAGVMAESMPSSRAVFIKKTYLHLMGAILGFIVISAALFQSGMAESLSAVAFQNWYIFLGAFVVAGWLFTHMARSSKSIGTQYLGLFLYVLAEAVIFCPLLFIAKAIDPQIITIAAVYTLVGFGALTAIVLIRKEDFSFLGSFLRFGFIMALITIIAALAFGASLGVWFSVIMIGLAGGAILYDTSNVLLHYQEDQYIAASLQLFASVALMFWYVLRILISIASDD